MIYGKEPEERLSTPSQWAKVTSGGDETNVDDPGSISALILSCKVRETQRSTLHRAYHIYAFCSLSIVMINTYSSSLPPPPPVPPRASHQEPRLGAGHTKGQIRGLTVLFFLHFLVTSGMFVYLFWSNNRVGDMREEAVAMKMLQECGKGSLGHQSVLDCLKISHGEGEADAPARDGQYTASGAMAHMKVEPPEQSVLKELQWNQKESIVKDIVHLYGRGMLQIGLSGYYYIYSQVTFSKTHPKIPLVQTVMKWSGTSGKEEGNLLMKAFCYKNIEEQCTSFQGGVFKLERGQKVSVNVTDMGLVHFDGTATTFGLFQLLQP